MPLGEQTRQGAPRGPRWASATAPVTMTAVLHSKMTIFERFIDFLPCQFDLACLFNAGRQEFRRAGSDFSHMAIEEPAYLFAAVIEVALERGEALMAG